MIEKIDAAFMFQLHSNCINITTKIFQARFHWTQEYRFLCFVPRTVHYSKDEAKKHQHYQGQI